jgi:transcriptional regulator with XRE-family HTH domain
MAVIPEFPQDEERFMTDSFGARLRRERERRSIEIADVAARTKIKASLFEALERNDVSQWPAGLFRRSFIRAYAEAVGLDVQATLVEFVQHFPDLSDPAADRYAVERKAAPPRKAFAFGAATPSALPPSAANDKPAEQRELEKRRPDLKGVALKSNETKISELNGTEARISELNGVEVRSAEVKVQDQKLERKLRPARPTLFTAPAPPAAVAAPVTDREEVQAEPVRPGTTELAEALRLTLAEADTPFGVVRITSVQRARWIAVACDLAIVLVAALVVLAVSGHFWIPLAVSALAYYAGGTLLVGNSPGVYFLAPPEQADESRPSEPARAARPRHVDAGRTRTPALPRNPFRPPRRARPSRS